MEDDIALITKRMQKFMMKNKFGENNTSLKKKIFELQKELDEIKENFSKVEA